MANITLTDSENRNKFFRQSVLTNLQYWQRRIEARQDQVMPLGDERNGLIRALSFALELEEAWPAVCDLIMAFSPYMERGGHWDIWNRLLKRAVKIALQIEDEAGATNLSALLARLLFQQSRFEEATAQYRQTIGMARDMGDQFNEARACTNLGYYFVEQGYWYRAEILCCHALKLFEQLGNKHGLAHTKNHLGILYTRQHRWDQAREQLEQACEIWQSMADEHGLMRGFINLGLLYLKMGQPEPALKHLQEALSRARSSGEETATGIIYMNMGLAKILDHNFAEGELYTRRAETIFGQYSNSAGLAQSWDNLGMACLYQGKWGEAISYLEDSLQTWRSLKNIRGQLQTLADMVEYELVRENRTQAIIRLKELEKLLDRYNKRGEYDYLQPTVIKYRRSLAE